MVVHAQALACGLKTFILSAAGRPGRSRRGVSETAPGSSIDQAPDFACRRLGPKAASAMLALVGNEEATARRSLRWLPSGPLPKGKLLSEAVKGIDRKGGKSLGPPEGRRLRRLENRQGTPTARRADGKSPACASGFQGQGRNSAGRLFGRRTSGPDIPGRPRQQAHSVCRPLSGITGGGRHPQCVRCSEGQSAAPTAHRRLEAEGSRRLAHLWGARERRSAADRGVMAAAQAPHRLQAAADASRGPVPAWACGRRPGQAAWIAELFSGGTRPNG